MSNPEGEPLYDLATRSWDHICSCILAEQRDPECPWHGRPQYESEQTDEQSTQGETQHDHNANR